MGSMWRGDIVANGIWSIYAIWNINRDTTHDVTLQAKILCREAFIEKCSIEVIMARQFIFGP